MKQWPLSLDFTLPLNRGRGGSMRLRNKLAFDQSSRARTVVSLIRGGSMPGGLRIPTPWLPRELRRTTPDWPSTSVWPSPLINVKRG